MINALKVVDKKAKDVKVVINGAGAAGLAICKLMLDYGFEKFIVLDSKGAIYEGREGLSSNKFKVEISKITNKDKVEGSLEDVIKDADIFIGVSVGGALKKEMVKSMADNAIVFAMANPTPEIYPDEAKEGGAKVTATGRSDFDNQINNSLIFPGIFRGLLESNKRDVDSKVKIKAAIALASCIENPKPENIIPESLNIDISKIIAKNIKDLEMNQKL